MRILFRLFFCPAFKYDPPVSQDDGVTSCPNFRKIKTLNKVKAVFTQKICFQNCLKVTKYLGYLRSFLWQNKNKTILSKQLNRFALPPSKCLKTNNAILYYDKTFFNQSYRSSTIEFIKVYLKSISRYLGFNILPSQVGVHLVIWCTMLRAKLQPLKCTTQYNLDLFLMHLRTQSLCICQYEAAGKHNSQIKSLF